MAMLSIWQAEAHLMFEPNQYTTRPNFPEAMGSSDDKRQSYDTAAAAPAAAQGLGLRPGCHRWTKSTPFAGKL